MNYTTNEWSCRVDFFKPSGKWYSTEAIGFQEMYSVDLIHDAIIAAIKAEDLWSLIQDGMTAVILEPYHKHSHPIMIKNKGFDAMHSW